MAKITDEERELFRKAVADVKPLKKTVQKKKVLSTPNHQISESLRPQAKAVEVKDSILLVDCIDLQITAEQKISFARPGVNQQVFRKLLKGQLAISASLDLHGTTKDKARGLLTHFIADCHRNNKRYLRIIHGKGLSRGNQNPILKNHLYYWLPQFAEVLAFQSAPPSDGGAGAVYVLLKAD